MDSLHHAHARSVGGQIAARGISAADFRALLLGVPPLERDAWLDAVLQLDAIPADGGSLPRGSVPYLPCPVDSVLRCVELAGVLADDVVVDVGSGVGRAAALIHLLTGAPVTAVEIQPQLVEHARQLGRRFPSLQFTPIEGDASRVAANVAGASVFFMYCPFNGQALEDTLGTLEAVARVRQMRLCCVDLPLPHRSWLEPSSPVSSDVVVYRSAWAPTAGDHGERT